MLQSGEGGRAFFLYSSRGGFFTLRRMSLIEWVGTSTYVHSISNSDYQASSFMLTPQAPKGVWWPQTVYENVTFIGVRILLR